MIIRLIKKLILKKSPQSVKKPPQTLNKLLVKPPNLLGKGKLISKYGKSTDGSLTMV